MELAADGGGGGDELLPGSGDVLDAGAGLPAAVVIVVPPDLVPMPVTIVRRRRGVGRGNLVAADTAGSGERVWRVKAMLRRKATPAWMRKGIEIAGACVCVGGLGWVVLQSARSLLGLMRVKLSGFQMNERCLSDSIAVRLGLQCVQ